LKEAMKMTKRISVSLNLLVDLKIGESVDIRNLIERLECSCIESSGEDAKIIGVKILDRKLLLEAEDDED
jgi:hypothetical protein